MEKTVILAGVLGLILISILMVVMALTQDLPDKNSSYTHSFTKAICNENNFCQDYEFICKDKSPLSIKATGFAVQFPETWKDPRDEENRKIVC